VTLLGALVKRGLNDPAVPLTEYSLVEYLGGPKSNAGVPVTEAKVWGLTGWYRAIALLAGTMGRLPFKVYRNGTRERVTQRTILDNPSPGQTPFEFWQTVYAVALGWGNYYGRKVRNGADQVVEVRHIHPSRVVTDAVDATRSNPAGKRFKVRHDNGTIEELTPWELMHIPYLSPDGIQGIRPLEIHRETLGIGLAVERTAANFYAKGARLDGILSSKMDLKKAQVDKLKAQWDERTGPLNGGGVAVLDNLTSFQPISIPPQDAQILASRDFTVDEIARLFGIPPHMLGLVAKSTSWGTGIEQQVLGFIKFTLGTWIELVEQRVTRELLPGGWTSGTWYAEYSLEGLLRGDSESRARFYHAAITDGWMNRNEVRVIENLEPADGLDEFVVPSNLTLVSVNGELVPLSAGGVADAATEG